MAVAPFSDQLPLNTDTFGSRISEFISRPVNYFITGFKPGYALQAAELNEIQEQFYLQQTLSNRCLFNWLTNTTVNGKPFWDGMTPLTPTMVSVTNTTQLITLNFSAGWYYLTDKIYTSSGGILVNSGFGVWCYIGSKSFSITKSSILTGVSVRIGSTYLRQEISSQDDETLDDNSNSANVSVNIPGADRIEFKSFDFSAFSNQLQFSDIVTISKSSSIFTVKYGDGSTLATING